MAATREAPWDQASQKQSAKKWPEAYRAYRFRFEANDLNVGDVVFVDVDDGKIVANAITQETHGRSSRKRYVSYDAVSDCMAKIRDAADRRSIPVVAMPRIGAGLANGNWEIIARIVECELADHGIDIVVYEL